MTDLQIELPSYFSLFLPVIVPVKALWSPLKWTHFCVSCKITAAFEGWLRRAHLVPTSSSLSASQAPYAAVGRNRWLVLDCGILYADHLQSHTTAQWLILLAFPECCMDCGHQKASLCFHWKLLVMFCLPDKIMREKCIKDIILAPIMKGDFVFFSAGICFQAVCTFNQ